jgi:hypothetical protein
MVASAAGSSLRTPCGARGCREKYSGTRGMIRAIACM